MARFVVEFRGELLDKHRADLHRAGISEESASSGVREGVLYAGQAFHVVSLDTESADAAVEKVRDALGGDAPRFQDWRVKDQTDPAS